MNKSIRTAATASHVEPVLLVSAVAVPAAIAAWVYAALTDQTAIAVVAAGALIAGLVTLFRQPAR